MKEGSISFQRIDLLVGINIFGESTEIKAQTLTLVLDSKKNFTISSCTDKLKLINFPPTFNHVLLKLYWVLSTQCPRTSHSSERFECLCAYIRTINWRQSERKTRRSNSHDLITHPIIAQLIVAVDFTKDIRTAFFSLYLKPHTFDNIPCSPVA